MRNINNATGGYVLNPRNVDEHSAFLADLDYCNAYNLYCAHVQHAKDRLKPK